MDSQIKTQQHQGPALDDTEDGGKEKSSQQRQMVGEHEELARAGRWVDGTQDEEMTDTTESEDQDPKINEFFESLSVDDDGQHKSFTAAVYKQMLANMKFVHQTEIPRSQDPKFVHQDPKIDKLKRDHVEEIGNLKFAKNRYKY